MGIALKNRLYWGLMGSICQRRGRASSVHRLAKLVKRALN